jgi:hypothetical protein
VEIRYRRRRFPGEVALAVEISNDLLAWRSAEPEFAVVEVQPVDLDLETVTLRSLAPPAEGMSRQAFARLVASLRE